MINTMYNPLLSGQAGVPWAPPVPDPHPALSDALLSRPVQDPRPRHQPGDKHRGQRLAQVIIMDILVKLTSHQSNIDKPEFKFRANEDLSPQSPKVKS